MLGAGHAVTLAKYKYVKYGLYHYLGQDAIYSGAVGAAGGGKRSSVAYCFCDRNVHCEIRTFDDNEWDIDGYINLF
ncbi:hypothetical protein ATZ36_09120 [Candidatus Endomicrobiellum trichonymphae]|uniref:Uncharacterized protein n=1 Tax=Endomicrobium trichonymphae TaxID=1408204 RepID=A0A1E5IH72_ENDTX|nr:hypothetical protein ATZ36_09120 [Candidatus Endomicrobium trichonymphae]